MTIASNRRVIRSLLVSYLAILCFLSLNPWILPDSKSAIGFITWDLVDHAIAYGALSLLMMFAFTTRLRPLAATALVIFCSSSIGILFEYGQYLFTVNRHFSFYDAFANSCGAVVGVLFFWSVSHYRKRFHYN